MDEEDAISQQCSAKALILSQFYHNSKQSSLALTRKHKGLAMVSNRWKGSKRAAAALFAGVWLSASAQAQSFTEYLGGGFLAPVGWTQEACARHGWRGVHQINARMQPQGARGNPDDESQLSLMFATGTIAMRYNLDRGIRATYRPSLVTVIWNGPWVPTVSSMGLSWFGGSWPVGNDAEFQTIRLRIDNFNEHEGCIVDASLFLRRNR